MSLSRYAEQFDTYFADRQHEIFSMIETLVNMDTYTHDGNCVNKMGEFLTGYMASLGFFVQRHPKPPVRANEEWMEHIGNVFSARSHERHAGVGIVLLGHMDTVFPAGTVAKRPFTIDGNYAKGPGVVDMKAGIVLNIFAARAIRDLGLMDTPLTLMFSPDEELGSPTTSPVYQDELSGALAAFCTEPGIPGGGVSTERKGSGHFHLRVTGKSAHAARDYELGASAILEAAHKIIAFNDHLDLANETTVNTGLISGGTSANSVPAWAEARVHITYRTMETGHHLVKQFGKIMENTHIPNTTGLLAGGIRLPPLCPTEQNTKLFELVLEAAGALDMPLFGQRSKGAAESGITSTLLDIPSICSMGPEGGELHTPDEYMLVDTVIPRCKLLTLSSVLAARVFTKR